MSLKLYEETDIKAIADAIREKNGSLNTYKVREMAAAIQDLVANDVVIDNPDYFYAETADTISKIATLRTENTLFIAHITDSHIYTSSDNKQYFDDQMASMKAVCAAIKPDLVVHGGDMTNGSENKSTTIAFTNDVVAQMREVGRDNTLILIGNHDGNRVSSSQSSDEEITEAEMLSMYRSWNDGFTYPDGKMYGYRDYDNLGLRVIRMHSYMGDGTLGGTGANWGYPSDEVAWFKDTALDTDHDVVLLSHQTLSPVLQGYQESQDIPHNGTTIQQAIDAWQTDNKKCVGVIHGHVHWDYVHTGKGTYTVIDHDTKTNVTRTGNYGEFYEYGLGLANYLTSFSTADTTPVSSYRDVPSGAVAYGRTKGTVTQALWTAIIINPTTKRIDLVRFGAGNDISMSYIADLTVSVTGVVLNATSGELTEGNSLTLIATVLPSDASNTSVTWSSSNDSVATVSGGVVTAVGAGSCEITVTTVYGGYTASYALTVNASVKINMLTQAIDSTGALYNGGKGYKTGYRINSGGVEGAYSGYSVTGFIPVSSGAKITVKNIPLDTTANGQYYIAFYDGSFTLISGCSKYAHAWIGGGYNGAISPYTVDDDGNLTSWTITGNSYAAIGDAKYIRFASTSITDDSAVYIS